MNSFKEYYNLLIEDFQSSINQAKKILESNGYSPDLIHNIIEIYKFVNNSNLNNQQKKFNVDSNIPILAYLMIANQKNNQGIDVLKNDYMSYIASPRATGQKILVNSFNKLKQTIQQNKWFTPSNEKIEYIWDWGNKLIEKIHELQNEEGERQQIESNDTEDIVYEDDKIIVYKADTKGKCIKYGTGSSLCISKKGGGNYYWSYRVGNMRHDGLGMTTYFVYWKNNNQRILIDALGDEDGPSGDYSWNPITPNTDEDITPEKLSEKYPELLKPFKQNVFKYIPFSEKEKRYFYIEENIYNILDPELKTLEDYEMFIETGTKINEYQINELSEKLSDTQMSHIIKKYVWSGKKILPKRILEKYLSSSDLKSYNENIFNKLSEKKQAKYLLTFSEGINTVLNNFQHYKNTLDAPSLVDIMDRLANILINNHFDNHFNRINRINIEKKDISRIRKILKNYTYSLYNDDYIFDDEGFIVEIIKNAGDEDEYTRVFNRSGLLLKDIYYKRNGDTLNYHYDPSGKISEITSKDKYGNETFYDKNDETPLYVKYKDGTTEYFDDTDTFLSSKDSRWKKRNFKESFKLSQIDIIKNLANLN